MKAIKGLLGSKKAMMAFISAVVWGVGRAGLDLPAEHLAGVVAPLWVFIFGQGIADLGKGKAQHEGETAVLAAASAAPAAAPVAAAE